MTIKYGLKKEWLQFTRTFRLWGMLLAIFSFAIADPVMYKVLQIAMNSMAEMDYSQFSLSIAGSAASMAADYSDIMTDMAGMFNSSSTIFCVSMSEFCTTSLLIFMLLLMSPAGGEQKKRATIIPTCSGLDHLSYLVPKFLLYPLAVFVSSFFSSVFAGILCNMLFDADIVSASDMLLASFLCAVFMTFIIVIYMSVGLCTSRPGIATVFIYIGMSLAQIILMNMELTRFNPFTLRSLISGEMFSPGFVLADEALSITVGIVLSLVIGVMMFLLAYAVLNAKKINNQEDKPEF